MTYHDLTKPIELTQAIPTPQDLSENMAIIHHNAKQLSTDPHLPILSERNIEIELSFMRHEHYLENQSLENFEGIQPESIEEIINITHNRDHLIADIDGKGHLKAPIKQPITGLTSFINHCLAQKAKGYTKETQS